MRHRAGLGWRRACVCVAASVLAGAVGASGLLAVGGGARSANAALRTPGDAVEILDKAAKAIAGTQAISYEGVVTVQGQLGAGMPRHSGVVTVARADAGGWKVAVKGEVASTAVKGAPATPIHLGYDGGSAWSIREGEKAVLTKSVRKDGDLDAFFRGQSAGPLVAWPLLEDKPFAKVRGMAELDGTQSVAGEACTIVKVSGVTSDDGTGTVRYFIANSDGLPRRVEHIHEAKDVSGRNVPLTRVLELANLKKNDEVSAIGFTLNVPEGYTVRAARDPGDARRKDADKKPRRGGGDPTLLPVGSQLPAFSLKDPTGKAWNNQSYAGKVMVIDFWGSWCPPCRKMLPVMQRLHKKYEGKEVAVVGFNFERTANANPAKFKKDQGLTYQLLLKAETVADRFKVRGWPTFYVVGPEGEVLWSGSGADPGYEQQIAAVVDEALEAMKK